MIIDRRVDKVALIDNNHIILIPAEEAIRVANEMLEQASKILQATGGDDD